MFSKFATTFLCITSLLYFIESIIILAWPESALETSGISVDTNKDSLILLNRWFALAKMQYSLLLMSLVILSYKLKNAYVSDVIYYDACRIIFSFVFITCLIDVSASIYGSMTEINGTSSYLNIIGSSGFSLLYFVLMCVSCDLYRRARAPINVALLV